MDVTNTGTIGTSGADGSAPSASGGSGTAGQDISATVDNGTDADNSATANGGSGGNGGLGAAGSPPGASPGGNGGNGAVGGSATASATTTTTTTGMTEANATAAGGTGGAGAQGAQLDGLGGSGADGGTAENTSAVAVDTMGEAFATATDSGGAGGDSSQDTQPASDPTYQGRVFPGGNGGAVADTTASAIGLDEAGARVTQTGGDGGGGTEGGTGAASTLTNAVSGSTTDGTLQLNQQANGGAGGEGSAGPGGQGGAAASDLTFDDTASPTQSDMVEVGNVAIAGAAGDGTIGSVAGVDASADTTITGAHDVEINSSANGGAGGVSGFATATNAGGDGGLGGNASGSALGATTSATGLVTVDLTVVGGAGGDAEDGAFIDAVPGAGGNGGQATIGLVSGTGGASADVEATLTAGNGGTSDGALGGRGAAATLVNAVTGSTHGGVLTLDETAGGGIGGDSFGGTGGQGGDATATLAFDDTVNATKSATFFVNVEAIAGQGGFDQIGANPGPNQMGTSRQLSGDGGSADASGTITAATMLRSGTATTVNLTVQAAGGGGLDGGDATADATATGGTANVQAFATADGGLEQGDIALDHAGTATANATGTDAGGFVTAKAASNLDNQSGTPLSMVSGTASAVVDGTSAVHAVAGFNQQGSFDTTGQAVADIVGLPSAPMAGTDVAAGETLLFDVEQGSSGVPGASGSQTTTTTINASIDLTPFNTGSEFLLDLHQATVIGSGVTNVTFDLTNIATPIHEVFSDAASAAAFFTDDVIDLGSFNTVTNDDTTLFVQMKLAVTTDDASSGFFAEIEGAGTACYCAGTRIRTSHGPAAIEDLRIGDPVVTLYGPVRPIKWIGWRSYDGRFVAGNRDVLPIRIEAGAIADRVPARALMVSPKHAMFIDGMLIPAEHLVNGSSIVQMEAMERLEYFHIELESHDIIFANGAPSESFVDCDNRMMFQNGREFAAKYPRGLGESWRFCAERVERGPRLEKIQARLAHRAENVCSSEVCRQHSILDRAGLLKITVEPETTELHLLSTPASPPGDLRRLGAAIVALALDGTPIDIDDARLCRGFHPVEQADERRWRWTDGNAVLRLAPALRRRELSVQAECVIADGRSHAA